MQKKFQLNHSSTLDIDSLFTTISLSMSQHSLLSCKNCQDQWPNNIVLMSLSVTFIAKYYFSKISIERAEEGYHCSLCSWIHILCILKENVCACILYTHSLKFYILISISYITLKYLSAPSYTHRVIFSLEYFSPKLHKLLLTYTILLLSSEGSMFA